MFRRDLWFQNHLLDCSHGLSICTHIYMYFWKLVVTTFCLKFKGPHWASMPSLLRSMILPTRKIEQDPLKWGVNHLMGFTQIFWSQQLPWNHSHSKSSITSHAEVIIILVNFAKFGTLSWFIILYHSASFQTRRFTKNEKLISKQVTYLRNKHIAISHTDVFAKHHSITRVTYLHICQFFAKIHFT